MSPYRVIWVRTLVAVLIVGAIVLAGKQCSRSSKGKSAVTPKDASSGGGLASVTPTPSLTPTPTLTPTQTATIVYVATNGLPGNDGSAGSPIDLATAVSPSGPVRPGYTVQLSGGIYRYSSVAFAPAGSGPNGMTVFKAAPGARVIITSPANTPPNIYTSDYMRLDGLWFGGTRQTSDLTGIYTGRNPISHWIQIVNCTIWGYYGAVKSGSQEYGLYQGNRFVRNGGGTLFHDLYISSNEPFPGPPGTATQHNIVDNNIFVAGGGGYAVHFYHNNHTNIITRNSVFQHRMGIVHDGSDALIANNLLWNTAEEAMWVSAKNSVVINNTFGDNAFFFDFAAGDTVNKNAFEPDHPFRGINVIPLMLGQEEAQIGVSARAINNAISSLDTAFSQSVEAILVDSTIEPNFATLTNITVPIGSPLYHTGIPWYDADPINVGPNSGAPATIAAFWTAFRALGLKEYDSSGNISAE